MGQTDRTGKADMASGVWGDARRSMSGCGFVRASFGKYRQGWAKVGRSGWVRLIGREWVIWLVGGCEYACRSRCGYEQVWADMGKAEQRWADLDGSD